MHRCRYIAHRGSKQEYAQHVAAAVGNGVKPEQVDYVRELGIASRSYSGIDESVAALQAGRVDAIVEDAPILEHYAHTHAEQGMAVVGRIFQPDKYGFAFPHESELAHQVTLEILDLQEDGTVEDIKLKFFGNTD